MTLPPSGKNNRLLGRPDELASNNKAFEESVPYVLFDDLDVVSQGLVIIIEYDEKDGAKIQLSEGLDFWGVAEKKQLTDLVVDDQDFLFNDANMDARKAKSSNIFITALHDATGNKTDTALVDYTYTRPCYYFRNILDRIVSEIGYSIDYTDVLSETETNSIGCPSNTKDFLTTDYKRRFQNINVLGNLDITLGSVNVDLGTNTTLTGTDTLNVNNYKTSFVFKGTVFSSIGTSIEFVFNDRTERLLIPSGTSFINFKSDTSDIGSSLVVRSGTSITLQDVYLYSAVSEGDIFDVEESFTLAGGWVLADYNLPAMTYKMFIKTLLKMAFLDVKIDNVKKVLTISRFTSSLNTNNVTDLSGRVQRNVKYKSGKVYGKLNLMNYQNDDDVDTNLGSLFFNIENENAEPTKSFLSIPEFSASKEVFVDSNRVIQMQVYNVPEVKRKAVADRIIYFDESGTFGINATFSEVSFQRIHSKYYFQFIDSTKRERVIPFKVNLTNLLSKQIEDNPLIYIDFMQSYFLVTSINGFERNSLTTLETLKFN